MQHNSFYASLINSGLHWSFERISDWGFVVQFPPVESPEPALRAGCVGCQKQFEYGPQVTLSAVETELAAHRDTCERLRDLITQVDATAGYA